MSDSGVTRAPDQTGPSEFELNHITGSNLPGNKRGLDTSLGGSVLEKNTTLLSAGGEYLSSWHDVSTFPSVMMAILADQDGTAYFQFSSDGSTVESSLQYNVFASINEVHRLSVTRPYCRIRYLNGSADQTSFSSTFMAGAMPALEAPRSLPVGQDADAQLVRNLPANIDIVLGKYLGWNAIEKFGFNASVTTSLTDIWSVGGVLPYPTSAESVEILSSSSADTSGGLGAQTVEIQGLDANWDLQSETLTMNGTTAVASTKTWIRIFRLRSKSRGTYDANNLGTITCRVSGGGATRAEIPYDSTFGGIGSSEMTHYTVPNGKKALITSLFYSVEASKPINLYAIFKQNADDVTTPFTGERYPPISFRNLSGRDKIEFPYPYLISGKSDLKIQAYASGATTGFVSCRYHMIIIDDV